MIHTYVHTYDRDEHAILVTILRQAGMVVYPKVTLNEILINLSDKPAALVVVTVTEIDSFTTMTQIRQATKVPVILIVSSISEDMQVALYEAGADLVLLRPYSTRLLLAQARNLAYRGHCSSTAQIHQTRVGTVQLDPVLRTVRIGVASPILLTPREFQLLFLFYTHPGQILTIEQIIAEIWGHTGKGDKNLLHSLIARLRRKLSPTRNDLAYLQSVPGIGYRWVESSELGDGIDDNIIESGSPLRRPK
jgi:DNA-binding response OmpR family regulator